MGSKLLLSLLCVVSFLFTTSFCEESLIREVTDVQDPPASSTATRVSLPNSYLMKIKSFSLLANNHQIDRYESAVFEVSGYKWKLVLYPNGKKNASGAGYISLYLAIQSSNFISNNWEVYADVKFFVYNQTQDNYLTIQDDGLKRFDVANTEWGISQALPLETFNDAKNGYLVNNSCAFGTEVYVTQPTKNWEEFYPIKPNADESPFTWKIQNFSKLDKDFESSQNFNSGGMVWKLKLYPKGIVKGGGNWLSLYLIAYGYDNGNPRNATFYSYYKLRVVDQRGTNHAEKDFTAAFLPPSFGWGNSEFITLKNLQDTSKGYLVDDAVVVQSEIFKVSNTKYYP